MDVSVHVRIADVNLTPFLAGLGQVLAYVVDETDWIAIEHGARSSNLDSGERFSYPIGSSEILVAHDPEDSEYEIEVRNVRDHPGVPAYLAAAEFFCSEYRVVEWDS